MTVVMEVATMPCIRCGATENIRPGASYCRPCHAELTFAANKRRTEAVKILCDRHPEEWLAILDELATRDGVSRRRRRS